MSVSAENRPASDLRQHGEDQHHDHGAAHRIVAGFARAPAAQQILRGGRSAADGPFTKSEKRAVVLPTKPQAMRNSSRVRIA